MTHLMQPYPELYKWTAPQGGGGDHSIASKVSTGLMTKTSDSAIVLASADI